MKHLDRFIDLLDNASKENPMIRRWLYGFQSQKQEFYLRIVRLSLYPSYIPEVVREAYIQVLEEALDHIAEYDMVAAFNDKLLDSLSQYVDIKKYLKKDKK